MKHCLPIALLLASACAPDLGHPDWLVAEPRILAVQADLPEVRPGGRATFRVLYAGPGGELDSSAAAWSVCAAPLPLTERGAVAASCLGDLLVGARGATASLPTSSDACARFGPIGSPDVQRAREPDATGGYYQPIRVDLGGAPAFALERLRCPLAQASLQASQDYDARYSDNRNPAIGPLTTAAGFDAVPAGATIDLTIGWANGALESFPVLDPASQALVDQRETMAVSWFATAGHLRDSRTGSTSADSANRWTAPDSSGPVYLWAVVRDSRGGLSWASAVANVLEGHR